MKNLAIRFQIALILLIFLSPIIYLATKQFKPQIDLAKYDAEESARSANNPPLPWLTTQGRNIVDDKGKPVVLRGVNIASTTWGPAYEAWNPQAVTYVIDNWHANVIRSRIHEYEYVDNPATFFLKLETQILAPARAKGVYVILHPWFGENESLPDAKGIEMWVAVAKRYKNDPHVLYDLFAEPRDISQADLKQKYMEIIPKVRAANPRSLIFVTGLDWGREINSWLDNPLSYDNLVYRTNPYNKTGEFEGYFGKIALTKPVFIGEFGTESKLTMTEKDVQSLLGYANVLNIGWTAWHYSDSGCPCLLTNNDSFTPSSYGSLVKQALEGKVFPYTEPHFDNDTSKLYVYSDFLEHGFSDYSWLSTTNLESKDKTFSGNSSFLAKLSNTGGIYFHTSSLINPQEFSHFNFAIQTQILDNLTLRFRDSKDNLSNPIAIKNYATNSNSWATINIPTDQISLSTISGVILESDKSLPQPTPIYLDQMYFSK